MSRGRRKPPPPQDSEDERFRLAVEEAGRQGTLDRLIPRPSEPMDFDDWKAVVRQRLFSGTASGKRGAKKGPRLGDATRWRADLKKAFRVIEARDKDLDATISQARVADLLSITQKTLWRYSTYYAARDPRDSYWAILEEYRREGA
jgi:hypothetical protein